MKANVWMMSKQTAIGKISMQTSLHETNPSRSSCGFSLSAVEVKK